MPAPTRILVVDDEPSVLMSVSEVAKARASEWRVDTASSGVAALERIEHEDYDAILSDIRMPELDGLGLLAHCRALRPQTPFLVLTAYGTRDVALRALTAGAFGFLSKPLDPDYMIATLKGAIVVRHLNRKLEAHVESLTAMNVALAEDLAQRRRDDAEVIRWRADLRRVHAARRRREEEERQDLARRLATEIPELYAIRQDLIRMSRWLTQDGAGERAAWLSGRLGEMAGRLAQHQEAWSPDLSQGLAPAIERCTAAFQARTRMTVKTELVTAVRLPWDREILLYRFFEELLGHLERDASARTFVVRLLCEEDTLALEVRDPGNQLWLEAQTGDSDAAAAFREQAADLGGIVTVHVDPTSGTRVTVRVPLSNAAL